MVSLGRSLAVFLTLGALSLKVTPSHAQSPGNTPAAAPVPASPRAPASPRPTASVLGSGNAPAAPAPNPAVEEAKQLFRNGVALFEAGDLERALELFYRSRAAFPSVQNTSNAAICLDRLGRYDEALELYEQLLTEFKAGLGPDEVAALAPAMTALRARVANLWISADVAGASVVVDGRARATLPLVVPIRVLPGKRVVRVIKDGFKPSELRPELTVGVEQRLEVSLAPLADAGLLRIEDRLPGTTLFVDGAEVGVTPWEGTLGPGRHLVWTRRGDEGTAPKEVVVVQGQKAVVAVASERLGLETSLEVVPATATLAIDGVVVGTGRFRGRLPIGPHAATGEEPGYRPGKVAFDSALDGRRPPTLALTVDSAHPRWPRGPEGVGFVEALGGYALAPRLGADAATRCVVCPSLPLAHGLVGALRGGYRFPVGVALELTAGYLRLESSFERTVAPSSPPVSRPELAYLVSDRLRVDGPFAVVGVGYRRGLGTRFALGGRVFVGGMFSRAVDPAEVTLAAGDDRLEASLSDATPRSTGGVLVTGGDLTGTLRFGAYELGLSLTAMVLPLGGPTLNGRTVSIPIVAGCASGDLGCIPSGAPFDDERAHSNALIVSPALSFGRTF
ncbi:MAG: hypothetical protein FJ095_18320 [Deltaproteobacteria bacterium]|nr:hypothetical protein [Deltaproteobacteria bacterium]